MMIELLQNNFPTLMQGFGYTLLSSVIALVGSLILGTVFAVMQVMPQTWVRRIGNIYVQATSKKVCQLALFLSAKNFI